MTAKTPPTPRAKATPKPPAKRVARKAAPARKRVAAAPKFGARGTRLYKALTNSTSPEALKVLAEESARIADRLDELDRIIAGKGVLELMRFRSMIPYEDDQGDKHLTVKVEFSSVLGEARQQAGALRQILATLGVDKAATAPPASGGTGLDELKKRRADRQAKGQASS